MSITKAERETRKLLLEQGLKNCSNKACKQEKLQPLDGFSKDKRYKDGFFVWCKDCVKEVRQTSKSKKTRALYHASDSFKRSNKKYKKSDKAKINRKAWNLTKYWPGSTSEEAVTNYNRLFEEQNGCCSICNRHRTEFKKALAVDHNHLSGKVRGLLCYPCNNLIGLAKEKIEIFNKSVFYLTKHNKAT